MRADYSARIRRTRPLSGLRAYEIEISDHRGRVVRTVLTAGSRRDAELEATQALAELSAKGQAA